MNFLGLCFKLRTEVIVVGIGDCREKKKKKECLVLGDCRRSELHQVINGAAAGDGGDCCRSELLILAVGLKSLVLGEYWVLKGKGNE